MEGSRKINPIATLLVGDPLTDARLGIAPGHGRVFGGREAHSAFHLTPEEYRRSRRRAADRFADGRVDYVISEANHLTVRANASGTRRAGVRAGVRAALLENLGERSRPARRPVRGTHDAAGRGIVRQRRSRHYSSCGVAQTREVTSTLPRGRVFTSPTTPDAASSTYDASIGGNQDFPATSSSHVVRRVATKWGGSRQAARSA